MLRETLLRLVKSGRMAAVVSLLTYIGVSLLLGDGVITPAISIISAIEGVLLIPGLEVLSEDAIVAIAIISAFLLFFFQQKGADRISSAFGPFMLVWFVTLFVSGFFSLFEEPTILKVVNPFYAVKFLYQNGLLGFIVLSDVVLCATGGKPSMRIWDIWVKNPSSGRGGLSLPPSSSIIWGRGYMPYIILMPILIFSVW